jgi:hypothetical protein
MDSLKFLYDTSIKKQLEFDTKISYTNAPALKPPADSVEYIFPALPSVYNPIVAIHHSDYVKFVRRSSTRPIEAENHHEYLFQFELQDGQKS